MVQREKATYFIVPVMTREKEGEERNAVNQIKNGPVNDKMECDWCDKGRKRMHATGNYMHDNQKHERDKPM